MRAKLRYVFYATVAKPSTASTLARNQQDAPLTEYVFYVTAAKPDCKHTRTQSAPRTADGVHVLLAQLRLLGELHERHARGRLATLGRVHRHQRLGGGPGSCVFVCLGVSVYACVECRVGADCPCGGGSAGGQRVNKTCTRSHRTSSIAGQLLPACPTRSLRGTRGKAPRSAHHSKSWMPCSSIDFLPIMYMSLVWWTHSCRGGRGRGRGAQERVLALQGCKLRGCKVKRWRDIFSRSETSGI